MEEQAEQQYQDEPMKGLSRAESQESTDSSWAPWNSTSHNNHFGLLGPSGTSSMDHEDQPSSNQDPTGLGQGFQGTVDIRKVHRGIGVDTTGIGDVSNLWEQQQNLGVQSLYDNEEEYQELLWSPEAKGNEQPSEKNDALYYDYLQAPAEEESEGLNDENHDVDQQQEHRSKSKGFKVKGHQGIEKGQNLEAQIQVDKSGYVGAYAPLSVLSGGESYYCDTGLNPILVILSVAGIVAAAAALVLQVIQTMAGRRRKRSLNPHSVQSDDDYNEEGPDERVMAALGTILIEGEKDFTLFETTNICL